MILSAPSGGGKTTVAQALCTAREDVGYSISATTRPQRPGETDGVDYFFLTSDAFQARIDADEFLEWAAYGGHRYGTLTSEVHRILESGRHVVLDIEVQGARKVRDRLANVVSIFILPPSAQALRERLHARGTEGPQSVAERLRRAVDEVAEAAGYDYLVVNDDRTQVVADVARILDAETRRPARLDGVEAVLSELRATLAAEANDLEG